MSNFHGTFARCSTRECVCQLAAGVATGTAQSPTTAHQSYPSGHTLPSSSGTELPRGLILRKSM